MVVRHFWGVDIAFKDSIRQGLACLLIPYYSIFYSIKHWEKTKKPFKVFLIGFAIVIGTFAILFLYTKTVFNPIII